MFYVQESCVVTDRAKIIFGLKRTSPLPRVHATLQCPGIKHLKDNKTGRKSYRDANANGSLIVMLMSMIFVKTVWQKTPRGAAARQKFGPIFTTLVSP